MIRRSLNAVQIIHGIFTALYVPFMLVYLGNIESCLCACIFAAVNFMASFAIRGSFRLAKDNCGVDPAKLNKISSSAAYLLFVFSLPLISVPLLRGWQYIEFVLTVYINLTALAILMLILIIDKKYK